MAIERQPKELIARVPPISLNLTLKYGLVAWSRIRALEKSGRKFDAAFFNHIVPVSLLRAFRRRVPTVISVDATPPLLDSFGGLYGLHPASEKHPLEKLKHKLTRDVYADAACLLPWSNWVRDSLIRDYGIREEKIKVLGPGIDLQKWTGRLGHVFTHGQLSREEGGSERRINVLFVGQGFERKGGALLLRIAGQPEFQGLEFHFVTGDFKGARAENVFVHSDVGPGSDVLIDLYRQADIFVLPTRADLHPVVILEAMAMGLPVISTRVGSIGEMIRDGENGYTVPVDDGEALGGWLRLLVANADLRLRLGQNARRLVESKFNLQIVAERIMDCLIEAADRKRR